MAGGALQLHGPVAEGEVTDLGVVERLAAVAAGLDVVAFPEAGEVRAPEQEFTGRPGEVGGIGAGPRERPEAADAAADLVVPVVEQVAGCGVEEDVARDVAVPGRPVLDTGEQTQPAGGVREQVVGAADHVPPPPPAASHRTWAC
ncbi:hypothetical protein AQI88_17930 [Streptomyces cellostaticus]|uniref:Uncharacterized protein n=1 Tax=Streptomyces cellostaticus TaxID=67285 RepID=A0A117PWI2_9ACTN|nr:hypothetical protein AQI88_17930 [Streptomyces cellostaticus]GHI02060.1 hypothetical protein Scel_03810 [Streptomyces cellostaticus]